MVFRIFVEKKKSQAQEASALLNDLRTLLGINALTDVRILNRYDAENISEELFDYAVKTVFSEPQLDILRPKPILTARLYSQLNICQVSSIREPIPQHSVSR